MSEPRRGQLRKTQAEHDEAVVALLVMDSYIEKTLLSLRSLDERAVAL